MIVITITLRLSLWSPLTPRAGDLEGWNNSKYSIYCLFSFSSTLPFHFSFKRYSNMLSLLIQPHPATPSTCTSPLASCVWTGASTTPTWRRWPRRRRRPSLPRPPILPPPTTPPRPPRLNIPKEEKWASTPPTCTRRRRRSVPVSPEGCRRPFAIQGWERCCWCCLCYCWCSRYCY